MKITSVRAFLMSYRLPEPLVMSYYGGERTVLKRDALFVRVESSNGLVGYGPGQGSEKAHAAIESSVKPFLEGRELHDPDALRVLFQQGPGRDPELMKVYCTVEVALYDLLGKQLGVPVSELVGGRIRDRVRLYGSAGMYQPPEEYAAEAARIAGLGFRAYKMRPALGPEEDLRTVGLMREAVGPGVDIMVDAHAWWRMGDRSYSPETIAGLAEKMAEHDIAWLEEPLPPDDHAGYKRLRDSGHVPIASGEHEPDEDGFLDLIGTGAVDYVQMDVVCQGGYAMCRRLLGAIARQSLRFAFHCWGTDLEVLAAAHMGVCWPETVVEWLEYPVYTTPACRSMYPFPLAQEILSQPLVIEGGDLVLGGAPGLGIEVDESVAEKYPWIPGPWSYFKLTSPPATYAVNSDHSVKWAG
ncbi:MAG: mandelate racemase/muconate lactonizing enzyme family protein [Acidobacteria bacterium]|nr:mandelate racemase/muconate lactonizing enzyme family protein [Acidobacteriota bacterium]